MTTIGHEDEFRRLFEQESRSRLDELAELALELDRRGAEADIVAAMFRHAHTLKGGAGVVGFDRVAAAAHRLEDLIEAVRSGRRPGTPDVADAVLGAVDSLREMIACAMAGADQSEAERALDAALGTGDRPRPGPPAPQAPARGGAGAIPVPVGRLDQLVRLVGEGTAAQLRVGRLLSQRAAAQPGEIDEYRDLERALGALQHHAMRARMVSVATVAGPLSRAVRDLGRRAEKQVRWEVAGADTELDRHVLERLREPLVALVRNAVDHGIEPTDERAAEGKDPVGTVRLRARQAGAEIVISVTDDGRGIDLERLRRAAGRATLSDDEVIEAMFRPGVSTAISVTGVSGRGVGLDEVRTAVEELRGRIEVESEVGEGTEFRISVPMTLALVRCVLVRVGGESYAIPMHSVAAVLGRSTATRTMAEGRPVLRVGDETLDLTPLGALLDLPATGEDGHAIVLATPAGRHAFAVDEVTDHRDVMVKELGQVLPRLALVAGASIEPDGRITLVLDPGGLLRAAAAGAPAQALPAPANGTPPARASVLVVDDALMTRELARSILARAGYEVVVASDGEEALRTLAGTPVELVITDIEMPNMDGIALTQAIRASEEHAHLPVVVLTSRGTDADRRAGLEAGADAYLVKRDFDHRSLLDMVSRLLGES